MKNLKSKIGIALITVFCMVALLGNVSVSAIAANTSKKVVNKTVVKKSNAATKAKAKANAKKTTPTKKTTAVKKPVITPKPAVKVNPAVEEGKIYNSFIADAKWLSQNLNNKDVLVLDARGPEAYAKSHIKGAVAVKWQWFADVNGKPGDKNWGLPLGAEALSKKFAEYGVDANKTIVVYADALNGWGEDGRIVWMLRMLGLNNVKMLNGGIGYWTSKNFETSTEEVKPVPTKFSVSKMDYSYMATTEWVNSNLGKIQIVDSRNKDEYEGATKYGEARGGHLPGAISLTFTNVFHADGTFKSLGELKKLFKDAGLKNDSAVATYCTAGIRSAHESLALRMAGYTKAVNFASSFYGWAGDSALKIEK